VRGKSRNESTGKSADERNYSICVHLHLLEVRQPDQIWWEFAREILRFEDSVIPVQKLGFLGHRAQLSEEIMNKIVAQSYKM
jgi:hypothetical protein